MKALDALRDQREALEAALCSTAPVYLGMLPFANLVRALADPRPLPERQAEAILTVLGALPINHDPRSLAGVIHQRIENSLAAFPLVEPPCEKTIRKLIRKSDIGIPNQSAEAIYLAYRVGRVKSTASST